MVSDSEQITVEAQYELAWKMRDWESVDYYEELLAAVRHR